MSSNRSRPSAARPSTAPSENSPTAPPPPPSGIGHLATEAASEAVQLQAARAVLADLMGMSDYATIENRLADVERRIAHAQPDPQQQGASHRPG